MSTKYYLERAEYEHIATGTSGGIRWHVDKTELLTSLSMLKKLGYRIVDEYDKEVDIAQLIYGGANED